MHRQTHLPITQIMDNIPIVIPYVHQSLNQVTKSCLISSRKRPQQQLIQDRVSNIKEQPFDRNIGPITEYYVTKSVGEQSEKITTSIKYQDRNKKLNFKINFRNEQRQVNGCFHRDDKLATKTSSDAYIHKVDSQPKKKWIRHYMTGKMGKKTNDWVTILKADSKSPLSKMLKCCLLLCSY